MKAQETKRHVELKSKLTERVNLLQAREAKTMPDVWKEDTRSTMNCITKRICKCQLWQTTVWVPPLFFCLSTRNRLYLALGQLLILINLSSTPALKSDLAALSETTATSRDLTLGLYKIIGPFFCKRGKPELTSCCEKISLSPKGYQWGK